MFREDGVPSDVRKKWTLVNVLEGIGLKFSLGYQLLFTIALIMGPAFIAMYALPEYGYTPPAIAGFAGFIGAYTLGFVPFAYYQIALVCIAFPISWIVIKMYRGYA